MLVQRISQNYILGKIIVVLLVTVFVIVNICSVIVCKEEVTATVKYVSYYYDKESGKEADIVYTYDNQEYNGTLLSSYYKEGDTLKILVNPNNPNHFIQEPFTYFMQNVFLILAFVVTVVVLSAVIKHCH